MRQRPLEDILATARLPRQSAIDALFGGPTVTKTPTVETTSLVEYAVQEYVAPDTGGYWMAAWTSVDEAQARGRLVDCRRVHGVERSFRLVELVTTKTVRVIEP